MTKWTNLYPVQLHQAVAPGTSLNARVLVYTAGQGKTENPCFLSPELCGVSPRRPMQGAISFGRWSGPCWGSDPLQGARPAGGNDLYRPCVESSFQSYLEASLEVTCTKAVCPEVLGVRSFQTSFVLPAELMDICLFVEVVAVLADVVQLQMINW